MFNLLIIMLGGAAGTGLRHLVNLACEPIAKVFPFGTLMVNVTGCLLIGCLAHMFRDAAGIRETYRLALIVGVLGGFTTFSSFGFDTFRLADEGQLTKAAINVLANNVLGIAAVVIGYRFAQRCWGS